MKNIEEAAKEYSDRTWKGSVVAEWDSTTLKQFSKGDFISGVEFAQRWIPVEEELPEKNVDVLLKVKQLAWVDGNYAIGYFNNEFNRAFFKIDGKHVSHYKEAVNNCVTHWRPIEYK